MKSIVQPERNSIFLVFFYSNQNFEDFRHLISVCHNTTTTNDFQGASTNGNGSSSNSPGNFSQSVSCNSTPTTPNLNRFRTLTCKFKARRLNWKIIFRVQSSFSSSNRRFESANTDRKADSVEQFESNFVTSFSLFETEKQFDEPQKTFKQAKSFERRSQMVFRKSSVADQHKQQQQQ